jgi:hypothetical protein
MPPRFGHNHRKVSHLYLSPNGIGCFSRFTDLTGTDYSKGAVELARNLAARDGFSSINFLVSTHAHIKLFLSMHATNM